MAAFRFLQEEMDDICSVSSHGFYVGAVWEGWEEMKRWWCAAKAASKLLPCPVQPFHSESVSLQWLEINCKIRKFFFWQPVFLILSPSSVIGKEGKERDIPLASVIYLDLLQIFRGLSSPVTQKVNSSSDALQESIPQAYSEQQK